MNTQHWTLAGETDHSFYITYTRSPRGGHSLLLWATWGCPQEQSEQSGAVRGRLCSIKRVGCWFLLGDDWLARIILSADKELKPILKGTGEALEVFLLPSYYIFDTSQGAWLRRGHHEHPEVSLMTTFSTLP